MAACRAGVVRRQGARGEVGGRIPGRAAALRRTTAASTQRPGRTVIEIPSGKYRPPLVPISCWIGFLWSRSGDDLVTCEAGEAVRELDATGAMAEGRTEA